MRALGFALVLCLAACGKGSGEAGSANAIAAKADEIEKAAEAEIAERENELKAVTAEEQ